MSYCTFTARKHLNVDFKPCCKSLYKRKNYTIKRKRLQAGVWGLNAFGFFLTSYSAKPMVSKSMPSFLSFRLFFCIRAIITLHTSSSSSASSSCSLNCGLVQNVSADWRCRDLVGNSLMPKANKSNLEKTKDEMLPSKLIYSVVKCSWIFIGFFLRSFSDLVVSPMKFLQPPAVEPRIQFPSNMLTSQWRFVLSVRESGVMLQISTLS